MATRSKLANRKQKYVELLLTFPNEIVPLVKDVLATNDPVWKYWCLECVVKGLPVELRTQFKVDLERLNRETYTR